MPPKPKPTPATSPLLTAAPILLAALLVTLPLLLRGNSCGHDQVFHLISWLEAAQQWTHGTLRPFWAFHPAWHAGEPRFIFYPPLSWALGALLGLVLPWVATTYAYTFIAVALCGFTMQALLRVVTPTLATAGACVYMANPYLLFCVYERAAYAELLAAAWIPLLLLCLLRPRIRPLPLAAVVALIWLTNVPAAILSSYTALLLILVRSTFSLLAHRHTTPDGTARLNPLTFTGILRLAGGYALGLALAGFYLVPAVAERSLVQVSMAVMPGMRPRDSFLFEHTGQDFHDAVLRHASWIAVAILTVAALSATALLLRRRHHQDFHSMAQRATVTHQLPLGQLATAGAALTAAILFLLTPASAAIWAHAPALALLQFPWRFLTVEAAVAVLLLTLVAASLHLPARTTLTIALVFTALLPWLLGNTTYRQPCDEEDAPAARIANYQADDGIDPTDEYTPADDDNDALKPDLPPAWLAASPEAAPDPATLPAVISTDDGHPAHLHFDVRPTPAQHDFVIRLRAYRGWALTVDGTPQPLASNRDDGLITLALPATGTHTVDLRYRWTADKYGGVALSLVALAATYAFAQYPSRKMKGKAA